MKYDSFLNKYCEKEEFIDRKNISNNESVDVIIPLINTNPLFEKNLYSFYREIPINRLIIGDGGCTDGSIEIIKKFPRVKVIDQSKYRSLGYCIAELISHVETKWFIYLHADVYLPENWYENMKKYQKDYDWFECARRYIFLLELIDPDFKNRERALSGSQMGRKDAFKKIIPIIKDDYLQRNEDIIFHELILNEGFKYGRIFDTFHYHQIMNKRGEMEPDIKKISIKRFRDKEWEKKVYTMQAKGIIKYLNPKPYLISIVNNSLSKLLDYNELNINQFKKWVYKTNKIWLNYIKLEKSLLEKLFQYFYKLKKICIRD